MSQIVRGERRQPTIIFIISDSLGETARRLVQAGLAQFPQASNVEVKQYPFVTTANELTNVLEDAKKWKAVVVTTLVDKKLNLICQNLTGKNDLRYFDYMSGFLDEMAVATGSEPAGMSGALHRLDKEYFNKVDAIEFAVKYDDGKDPKGFLKSDLVLLGISRTSKTPLSIYLANKAYKVSNLPLIPEVPLPRELEHVSKGRVIGLTASPKYIANIRSQRLKLMGLGQETDYNSLVRIYSELSYAEEVYNNLGALVINIEDRSIEETAQVIEEELGL